MHVLEGIFWNEDQRRLRTLWRLIGHLVILGLIVIVVGGVLGFVVVGWLAAQGGISPVQLSDPWSLQGLITDTPMLTLLTSLALAVPLAIGTWLAGRILDRRPFADFGFHLDRDWWIDFSFGLLLGAMLMLIIFVVELALGWVTVTGTLAASRPSVRFVPTILTALVSFVAVGFYEELFSRGYQLKNLAEGLRGSVFGARTAIAAATLLSSLAFGGLHVGNPHATTFSTLSIALAGTMLATGFLLTGELAIPIGLHITWNFFQGSVFGFPVSGIDFRSASFLSTEQLGPALWTGGAFGPEAGLLGLGAMILGVLLTTVWVRRRYGRVEVDISLADAPRRIQRTS
ncbi:MAG: CPBP family intramembrane metalloprotease [Anaerolineae bacterium]